MKIAYCTLWNTIRVTDEFFLLPADEQIAILLHEQGHIQHFHAVTRLMWVVSFFAVINAEGYFQMCERQELEADAFVARMGLGEALARFVNRLPDEKALGYPWKSDRLAGLKNV